MANTPIKQNKLRTWLLTKPLMFAAMTTALFLIVAGLASLTPIQYNRMVTSILAAIAGLITVIVTLRTLPAANLDRRSFVAVNTALTLSLDVAILMLPVLLGAANPSWIMQKFMLFASHSITTLMIVMSTLMFISLYVIGLALAAFYARYRRIRAMGVTMWRAVLTLPFGFFMLWMPGYVLPDDKPTTQVIATRPGIFTRILDWIVARPLNTAIVFVVQFGLLGLILGAYNAILSITLMAIFALWVAVRGVDKTRQDVTGKYGTLAIVINIASIIITTSVLLVRGV